MRQRCFNPNSTQYPHYGGRGITVCDRWNKSFSSFYEDVGDRPGLGYSLERIDNDKGYEPANVRWATAKEQANNRRSSRHLTLNGETKTLAQWAETVGVHPACILWRLKHGWPMERALTAGPTDPRDTPAIARQIAGPP